MKALQAGIEAMGWQGGTIPDLEREIDNFHGWNSTVYQWGLREGIEMRYGLTIHHYPIPLNSWSTEDNKFMIMSYLKGLKVGLSVAIVRND